MYRQHESPLESANVVGAALRSVERQRRELVQLLSQDARQQRAALFHYLDQAVPKLFALVVEATEGRLRAIRVTDVPLLAERLPAIFHAENDRDFNPDMFNDWLLARDLSHHFHGDGIYLKW